MDTDNSTDTLSDEGTIPAADDSALDEQEIAEYLSQDPESKNTDVASPAKCDEPNLLSDEQTVAEPLQTGQSESFKCMASVTEGKKQKEEDPHESVAMDTTDADDEDSSFNQSCSSSVSSTPIKHLEPPTPHPASQKTKKSQTRDTRTSVSTKASKFPQRAGIMWKEGAKVEARDFQEKWYAAKILELDSSDNTILVHFDGWNSRFDEWLPMDSERIRCVTRHSERKDTRSKATNKTEHKIGECVFAKWTDCRMYPGKIVAITSAGNYDVLFYDGFRKTVVPINVKTMPDDVQLEYAKAGLLPEVGKKNKFPIKDLAKEIQEKQKVKSPEPTRRSRSDGDRRSSIEKDKKEGKKEVKKEELWETKSSTEKRRKSAESQQSKKQKTEVKEETKDKKERRESIKEEVKVKKETTGKSGKLSKEKNTSPVGKRCEKTTPKSAPRTAAPPADTLTTEPPSEEYSCPYEPCQKSFRKKSLMDYHVKFYHTDDGTSTVVPHQPHQPHHRKRKSTAGSEDGEHSTGGSRHKSRRMRRDLQSSIDGSSQPSTVNEDGMSEDTKTTTTEDYQQEVLHSEDEEEDNTDGVDRIEKDEVVNCICQINEENGLMIQCDVCLCWQHAVCMELTEETLPAKYVCYVCANPPGVRESGKYIYDQDWIKLGTMHRFNFLPDDRHSKKKARIMKATHALVGDMLGVQHVLNATRRELSVVNKPDSSELKLWTENLDTPIGSVKTETEINVNKNNFELANNNIKQETCEEKVVLPSENGKDHVNNETETVGEIKVENKSESKNISVNGCSEGATDEKNSNHVDFQSEGVESKPELSQETTTSTDNIKNEAEGEQGNVFEKCSVNLLEHISHIHDSIDERLYLIEQQVTELEAAEEGKNSTILKDVPKVKKSMHQLINDLYKVKRLAMYH